MYEGNASSSSNDIAHNIEEYNTNSDRWIECNNISAVDFDMITSRISHATDKFTRQRKWIIIIQNINEYYKIVVNFLKRRKDKRFYRNIFQRHKNRNDFFVYEVSEVDNTKRLVAEREWYKREYSRQVGEPKPKDNEALLKKATAALIRQSKCIPFERICYAPPLKHISTLAQVNWKGTPLALTCTCPADLCVCSTRKSSLLPPAKIPSKKRHDRFGIKSFCWAMRFMKYPKPAGTLIPKLVEVVKKEAEYYRSAEGRKALKQKGPEFCMSGCLQYLVSSMAVDAPLAAEIAKMHAKVDVRGLGMLKEEEEGAEESVSAEICDEFSCSVATQTENDPDTGELTVGDYSGVLYGSIEDSIMNDVEGIKLQISTYSYEPPDPCAFNINKVLHVEEIKNHISKIKDMYSAMSTARESHCCNDVSRQFQGLSLIESLGSIIGKCKYKPVLVKEHNVAANKKEDGAGDIIPEEPEFVCPPLILGRIVDIKHEISDLLKKYFKRIEAPHPCISDKILDKKINQWSALKLIDSKIIPGTAVKEMVKNMIRATGLEEIDENIKQKPIPKLNVTKIIQVHTPDIIEKNFEQNVTIKINMNINQDSTNKVIGKKRNENSSLEVTHKNILDTADKLMDTNVIKDVALQINDEKDKHDSALRIEKNINQEKVIEINDKKIIQDTTIKFVGKIFDSANHTKMVNGKLENDNVLKSCDCMKKSNIQDELCFHKVLDCTIDKYGTDINKGPSDLEHITSATDQNKKKSLVNILNVVKSQSGSGNESKGDNTGEGNYILIKKTHKSSTMKINFGKNIRSSLSKSSLLVRNKRSSIDKLNKPSSSNSRSASNSEEFKNSGVLTMISRKLSNSGWRGWFSFVNDNDKMGVCRNKKRSSNIRLPGKIDNKENAIKKYQKNTKRLEQSISDSQSYYTDEVVQNVESLRNLSSTQTTDNESHKNIIHNDNQESEPKMPKHYRFYY